MSNAELIAEARSVVSWNVTDEITGPNDDLLEKLAGALEEAERKIKLARAVFADSEEGEDVSNAMDIALA